MKILILFVIVLFFVGGVSALPVVPELYGFGTTWSMADSGGIPVICIVDTLTTNSVNPEYAIADDTRNGVAVKTGALKACINYDSGTTGKYIIFEVSGTIYKSGGPNNYYIYNSHTMILGQTAPSPGITIRNIKIVAKTNHILLQHLRIRHGDESDNKCFGGSTGQVNDTFTHHVLDHMSLSWGIDGHGGWGQYGGGICENHTIANSIISEGLDYPLLDPDNAAKGWAAGTYASGNVAVIKNLFAHNRHRNPLIQSGKVACVNNIAYNCAWFGASINSPYGPGIVSYVGNINRGGPSSNSAHDEHIITLWSPTISPWTTPLSNHQIYLYDNKAIEYSAGTERGQTDSTDWSNVDIRSTHTIYGNESNFKVTGETPSLDAPLWPLELGNIDVDLIENQILVSVGARPADRDSVDNRIILDVQGSTGGLINSQTSVGGWPVLAENTRTLTLPTNPHADDDSDGYTNLEGWIHGFSCDVEGPQSASCAQQSTCSSADTDTDGFVSITELINYITGWKAGNVNIADLINGITEWKNGC